MTPQRSFLRAAPAALVALLAALSWLDAAYGQAPIQSELVLANLSRPVQVTAPPGDFQRLFVIEQWSGKILIVRDGAVAGVFLTVGPLATSSEQGLLGLTFHPAYSANGKFYVSYCDPDGTRELAEYHVSSNPDLADPASRRILLSQPHPLTNHNGGQILFGPDGYLYMAFGDGGGAGDTNNNAQNDGTWLGKMLRIDVDSQDPGLQYHIPPTNPFVGPGDPLDEIWAKGLRNPWRFSFDRLTGDLYIADVGQDLWEEVDFQPAGSPGGQNYGWRLMEGDHCYNPSTNCNPGNTLTLPVFEYSHSGTDGNPYTCPSALDGCAITGGFVYRGPAIPEIVGRYFFSDNCSNRFNSFQIVNGLPTDCQEHTDELNGSGQMSGISSFGENGLGELYICALGGGGAGQGSVYKIVRNPPLPDADADGIPDAYDQCPNNVVGALIDATGCPLPLRGDYDGDGDVDDADLATFLTCFSGPTIALPAGCSTSDFDADDDVDQVDFGAFQACYSGANHPASASCLLNPL